MRRQIPAATWDQLKTAHASGLGLREIARDMGIPAGTVLARAKREGWTQQIAQAKLIKRPSLMLPDVKSTAIDKITPFQSVVVSMRERAERYTNDMADVSERVVPHLKRMKPREILDNARNVEQLDRVARRNFGLDDQPITRGPLSLEILGNHTAVQIVSAPPSPRLPEQAS